MLVVNRELRVANDVDEENVGDFQLDLLFNSGGILTGETGALEIIATQLPIVERKAHYALNRRSCPLQIKPFILCESSFP